MQIKVYPSLMPGDPVEVHDFPGQTIAQWFESNDIDYLSHAVQPVTIKLNGKELPTESWATVKISAADEVAISLIPNGSIIKGIGSIIGGIVDFFFGWLSSSQKASSETPAGQKLETTDAVANAPKFTQIVPEQAGRFKRFPDYLAPPRRYFQNEREQWLEIFCCQGPGSYEVLPDDVKIGDTTFASLGDGAEYVFYEPGADLSAEPAHEHWHTVEEVGGTSSGTAGLELSAVFSSEVNPTATSYDFSGAAIHIDPEDGKFPEGWGAGTVIDIRLPMEFEVEDSPADPRYSRFTGNFFEAGLSLSLQLSVSGPALTGTYTVSAFSVDSVGNGWAEFTTLDTEGLPIPLGNIAPGTYTLAFYRGNRRYSVVSQSEQDVTIAAISFGVIETGWPGFPVITSTIVSIVTDPSTIYGDWTSAFAGCPAPEKTDTVELSFYFPAGLGYVNNSGGLDARGVRVEAQYRDVDAGGSYTSLIFDYAAATLDGIGYTERLTIATMRPEFRCRRLGAADTSTQVQDKVQWYSFCSRLDTLDSYPNWTTMAVRIRGGGKLAVRSENKVNVTGTRVLPTLLSDGTWSAPMATRDVSAFARYIATTIGYTDDDIDMGELLRLHNVWTSRGETLDYIYDLTTVKEALSLAFGAGMGDMTIDDGRIRPVRDDVRTNFEQGYSPQNMSSPLRRSFRSRRVDDPDGVEVEFINGSTWVKEVVQCFLPGDEGLKLQKIKLNGVLDRTRAWRIGMRARRAYRYRNWEYSFGTELDALNSKFYSYVPLFDDIPGYGQSALLFQIVASPTGAILRTSEKMRWEPGKQHIVGYRDTQGNFVGPFSATPGDDEFSIRAPLPTPWVAPSLKMELPHVYFGTVERFTFPALITSITPNALESVNVTATNYSVEVYADDNSTPPSDA